MIFYHGTTEENWKLIQEEGILFGKRGFHCGKEVPRCTYLAVDKEEAKCYGDVVLQVEYEPKENSNDNNYFDNNCWQIRVYIPIMLDKVKRVITIKEE